jgi:hypothetical protein
MPRATCRCGEILTFPDDGPDRIVCPKCSARIRVRRANAPRVLDDGDGFIRFACACGRRLKVRVDEEMPESGMCPDCGRVVPVPAFSTQPVSSQTLPTSHPEAITDELSTADLAMLEQWTQKRLAAARPPANPPQESTMTIPAPVPAAAPLRPAPEGSKVEAGLRVCPRCGKPVHLSAIVCRECGAHVPKR